MMKENNPILQVGVSVMIWIITILDTYIIVELKTQDVANDVINKTLALEYEKVGWKANYEKINEIQKQQIIEWLQQYDAQWWSAGSDQNTAKPSTQWWEISTDTIKSISSWDSIYVLWNPDAEITWVEYSDIECPFCKRLHESWAIEEVIEAYDGKVNFIFKQFPLGFHKQAQMEAEASLCVGELSGTDTFYEFITQAFNGSKWNGESYTKESISELAGTLWVNKDEVLSCIESWKYTQEVAKQMDEGSTLFGITGTPGNVLINNKTGAWEKLPGAYPASAFKEKIDALLQ